jgi:DNA-binding PadR family transcriptional regulator
MAAARLKDNVSHDGLLGLYALTQMARLGPVHGYLISERIAERTEGAWRPGPGAIYPALNKLTQRKLARSRMEGRRRLYTITPEGRAMLARVRARSTSWASRAPDLSALWAEVLGVEDVGTFLLLRLRRSLDAIQSAFASPSLRGSRSPGLESLKEDVIVELTTHLDQLRRVEGSAVPAMARRAEGVRP